MHVNDHLCLGAIHLIAVPTIRYMHMNNVGCQERGEVMILHTERSLAQITAIAYTLESPALSHWVKQSKLLAIAILNRTL